MVTKIEGYKAHDGRIFLSEEAAVRHESLERLCKIIPEFQMIRPRLEAQLDAVATAMGPMLDFRRRVPSPGPIVDPSAGPCPRCDDRGIVPAVEPFRYRNTHDGEPMEGRRIEICPEIGCRGRETRVGPPVAEVARA